MPALHDDTHHHISPFFPSNLYCCHSLHWLSSNRQAHFQPLLLSAINLTLLISPFYSSLLLHHPSCIPPIGSLSGIFKQLTSVFSPPSICAILLLSIERSSYFVSAVHKDTTGTTSHFKIWFRSEYGCMTVLDDPHHCHCVDSLMLQIII